jgi:hypothetical protein
MPLASVLLAACLAVALSLAPTPAHAEPISLSIATVVAAVQAFAAASPILFNLALTATIAIVSTVARAVFAPDQENQGPRGTELQLSADPNEPRKLILGRRAVAGSLAYWCTSGTNNKYCWLVIALADHRIDALEEIHVNGEKVADWAATGAEVNASAPDKFDFGDSGPRMKIYFRPGTVGQSVVSDLTTDAPTRESGGSKEWTTDHRLDGTAYVAIRLMFSPTAFPSGRPSFLFMVRGARLYDPRLDSTQPSGSGAHRYATPGTWTYTDNLEVARYNYLRGMVRGADGRPLFGLGCLTLTSTSQLPWRR